MGVVQGQGLGDRQGGKVRMTRGRPGGGRIPGSFLRELHCRRSRGSVGEGNSTTATATSEPWLGREGGREGRGEGSSDGLVYLGIQLCTSVCVLSGCGWLVCSSHPTTLPLKPLQERGERRGNRHRCRPGSGPSNVCSRWSGRRGRGVAMIRDRVGGREEGERGVLPWGATPRRLDPAPNPMPTPTPLPG